MVAIQSDRYRPICEEYTTERTNRTSALNGVLTRAFEGGRVFLGNLCAAVHRFYREYVPICQCRISHLALLFAAHSFSAPTKAPVYPSSFSLGDLHHLVLGLGRQCRLGKKSARRLSESHLFYYPGSG